MGNDPTSFDRFLAGLDLLQDVQVVLHIFDRRVVGQCVEQLGDNFLRSPGAPGYILGGSAAIGPWAVTVRLDSEGPPEGGP